MTELSEQEEYTILKKAISQGTLEINKIIPNLGDTPLIKYIKRNSPKTVRMLLDNGANVHMCNKNSEFPINIAIANLCYEITELLIERGVQLDFEYEKDGLISYPFYCLLGAYYASENHNEKWLKLIKRALKNKINLHPKKCRHPIRIPLSRFDYDLVKLILENDEKVHQINWDDVWDDVCMFCRNADDKKIEKIISIVDLVQEYGAGERFLDRILFNAVLVNHYYFTKLLITRGADVNAVNENYRTPIYYAFKGDISVAKLLIDKGANLNVVDGSNRTPLLYSLQVFQTREIIYKSPIKEYIKLFIEHGGDINKESCMFHGTSVLGVLLDNEVSGQLIKYVLDNGGKARTARTDFAYLLSKNYHIDKVIMKLMFHYGINIDTTKFDVEERAQKLINKMPRVVSLNRMCLNVLYDYIDELIRIGFPPLLFKWPYDLGFYDNEKDEIEW